MKINKIGVTFILIVIILMIFLFSNINIGNSLIVPVVPTLKPTVWNPESLPELTITVLPTTIIMATSNTLPAPTPTIMACVVIKPYGGENSTVYIRSGPGENYSTIRVALSGEILVIHSDHDGWIMVNTDEGYGFIYQKWCK